MCVTIALTMLFGWWFSSLFVGRLWLATITDMVRAHFKRLSFSMKNNNLTCVRFIYVSCFICCWASSRRRNGNLYGSKFAPFFLWKYSTRCDCCKLSLDLFYGILCERATDKNKRIFAMYGKKLVSRAAVNGTLKLWCDM